MRKALLKTLQLLLHFFGPFPVRISIIFYFMFPCARAQNTKDIITEPSFTAQTYFYKERRKS